MGFYPLLLVASPLLEIVAVRSLGRSLGMFRRLLKTYVMVVGFKMPHRFKDGAGYSEQLASGPELSNCDKCLFVTRDDCVVFAIAF
jgi:hypothetical protein